MNVYDFDNTIYKGDSTLDFYFFCLKKDFTILRYLPEQISGFMMYKFGKEDKIYFKSKFFSFLKGIKSIDKVVCLFWDLKQKNIKSWYLNVCSSNDLIISASPEFLLKEICTRLGVVNLIASDVDKKNGDFHSKNCYGEEKVIFFKKRFPNMDIDKFYSDSYSDAPMAELSREAFYVKGSTLIHWKK